ncbi:MAG: PAS domain-containing protein, partial [bacterium]
MSVEAHLIPSLTEGLFLFDANCRLVRLNPSGERLLGRSERSMAGTEVEKIFPRNPDLADLIRAAIGGGRSMTQRDFELTNADGEQFFLSLSVSILQEPDGTTQGAVVLARDETLLREIDRSFRRADHLTTLATLNLGMAHEIKNPLGGIKGAAQLLRLELGDDHPLAEHCGIILREVERVDRLLESLLSAA